MAEETRANIPYEMENSHFLDGVRYYKSVTREMLGKIKEFTLTEDDVLVCGYPKSGNVWMTVIVRAIMAQDNLDMFENTKLVVEAGMLDSQYEMAETLAHPACFWTHLQFHLLPTDVASTRRPKVIYMLRSPKDAAVSYFHYHKMFIPMGPWDGEWEVFYEEFMKGKVFFGSWFDHVKSFSDNQKKADILFVKYEDLRKHPKNWIRKVANFINRPLNDKILERIATITNFNNMRVNPNLNPTGHVLFTPGSQYMRKGAVGDWRSLFTEKQNWELEEKLESFAKETGVRFEKQIT